MAEFFGDLERLAADAYPYRWPIMAAVLVAIAAVAAFCYYKGWHMLIWRRRVPVAIFGTPLLALVVFVGYDLGSPLFTNKTVEEEFPFAFSAIVPEDMDRQDVEDIMAGLSKVDMPMSEDMPKSIPLANDQPVSPTQTLQPTQEPTPESAPGPTSTQSPTEAPPPTNSGPDPTSTQQPTEAPPTVSVPAPTAVQQPIAEPTATPAPEPTATQQVAIKLKSGNFHDADSFHRGSGVATIYRGPDGSLLLRLEMLDVTNGPDLHVLLSPHPDPSNSSEVKGPGYVDLGKLKGNRGNQNYPIPAEVDVTGQSSVVIYCVPFSVIFSVAPLEVIA